MRYLDKNNEVEIKKASELILKIFDGIKSMLYFYSFLFNTPELNILKDAYKQLSKYHIHPTLDYELIIFLLELEDIIKPITYKCWAYEFERGSYLISWLKDDLYTPKPFISATLNKDDQLNTFCSSGIGIQYNIDINAFLGATVIDGGTFQSKTLRDSIYCIGEANGVKINSYNLATPIITPEQIYERCDDKHSEIVLDRRYVKEIKVIYTTDSCLEYATRVLNQIRTETKNVHITLEKKEVTTYQK